MFLAALVALAAAGCTVVRLCPGAPSHDFSTGRSRYAIGDEVELVLSNSAWRRLGYNLCGAQLERLNGDAWVPAKRNESRVCAAILLTLVPGRTDTSRETLDVDAPGTYRFSTRLEWLGAGREERASTDPFEVVAR